MGIILKNRREIELMRKAGRIVHAALDAVEAACVPGKSTWELNRIANQVLEAHGALPEAVRATTQRIAFAGEVQGGKAEEHAA